MPDNPMSLPQQTPISSTPDNKLFDSKWVKISKSSTYGRIICQVQEDGKLSFTLKRQSRIKHALNEALKWVLNTKKDFFVTRFSSTTETSDLENTTLTSKKKQDIENSLRNELSGKMDDDEDDETYTDTSSKRSSNEEVRMTDLAFDLLYNKKNTKIDMSNTANTITDIMNRRFRT